MKRSDYLPYLKTLRRLPDDVVLDMATREFDMMSPRACLCGWAMRAGLSLLNGHTPDELNCVYGWPALMAAQFGGDAEEWDAVYYGVSPRSWNPTEGGNVRRIEMAFVQRVAEAVR